jgi:hypothetical protein
VELVRKKVSAEKDLVKLKELVSSFLNALDSGKVNTIFFTRRQLEQFLDE